MHKLNFELIASHIHKVFLKRKIQKHMTKIEKKLPFGGHQQCIQMAAISCFILEHLHGEKN